MKVEDNKGFLKRTMQRGRIFFRVYRSQKIFLDIYSRFQRVNELANGYAFCYPQSNKWISKLTKFTNLFRERYPAISTELIYEPSKGPVWLNIQGPEGTKDFLENMMTIISSRSYRTFPIRTIKLYSRILTSRMRIMPDFFIIGAARCGTTALYDYLTQHPCVASAFEKEIYFFDHHFKRGISWYKAFFPTTFKKYYVKHIRNKDLITGEATPCYIFHPHAHRRVFEAIPNAKIIVLLRNPVDRAYSFYYHRIQFGLETLSFEDAIKKEEERLNGELEKMLKNKDYFSFNRQNYSYLSRGIYVDQLKNWMDVFPKNQILILKAEDFYKNSSETFKRVVDFLGLPSWEPKNYRRINSVPYPKMNSATRKYLIDYFKPYNQRLYDYLGMNFQWDK